MDIVSKISNRIQKVDGSKICIYNVMKSTLFEYENQIKEHVVPEITRARLSSIMCDNDVDRQMTG